jgi:8-amino-7-oxononanoate synthase
MKRRPLDFTTALYLGFKHSSWRLPGWSQLTTGRPAALDEPELAQRLGRKLARLIGTEAAVLGPSTLHLCWDLFGIVAGRRCVILMDDSSYAIARWGVERAAASGTPMISFRHHDVAHLSRLIDTTPADYAPVIVTDGFCTECGKAAPLAAYETLAALRGGRLVVDDSQALGVLGAHGGGSPRRAGVESADVLVIDSLAKGFGAPLAVLAGSSRAIEEFRHASETAAYCSPPSQVDLLAASAALTTNARCGDALRRRLALLVARFRDGLQEHGIETIGGSFPAQSIAFDVDASARRVYLQLRRDGVHCVLRQTHGGSFQVSFVLTARHGFDEIDAATEAIGQAMAAAGAHAGRGI